MGNIGNGQWATEGNGFNCTKCANDAPFMQPIARGDEVYIRLPYGEILPGFYVNKVHITTPGGVRILPNVFGSPESTTFYNAGSYLSESDGVLTMLIPPFFCDKQEGEEVYSYNPKICILSLADELGNAFTDFFNSGMGVAALTLYINGQSYNLAAGELPPGASWNAGGYRGFIFLNCASIQTPIGIYGTYYNDSGVLTTVSIPAVTANPCSEEDAACGCYIRLTTAQYNAVDRVVVGGVEYSIGAGVSIFQAGVYIPGFAATHVETVPGFIDIPIRCSIGAVSLFSLGDWEGTGTGPIPIRKYSYGCADCITTGAITCFAVEVELSNGRENVSIFTEPYECVMCENTILIEGDYAGGKDCLGNDYGETKGGISYKNTLRIPAVIRTLPAKLSVTKNEKCFTYKSEVTENYELQGTKAYPPYFARLVENVLMAQKFKADGIEYHFRSEKAFDEIRTPGVSAFALRAPLDGCPCEINFPCTPAPAPLPA